MENQQVKMLSYIKNAGETQFEKSVYLGEELNLKSFTQRTFKFESKDGMRIVRVDYNEYLRIKESYQNLKLDIMFPSVDEIGSIKYSQEINGQEYGSMFQAKLIDFKQSKEEIFIHYLVLDDLFNTLLESKIFLKMGE